MNSDAAAFNAGDLVGNGFDLPLFIPAIDLQYLSGSANNNLRFKDIDIQPVNLTSGQSAALNAIGTQTTASLRYIFPSNLTIGAGASLSVGPNVNVQTVNLVDDNIGDAHRQRHPELQRQRHGDFQHQHLGLRHDDGPDRG